MKTPQQHSAEYHLGTLLLSGAALFICQFAFLFVMDSVSTWLLIWLYPVGPILIAGGALLLTRRAIPLKKTTARYVLPFVLYVSGNLASLCIWWIDGAISWRFPLRLDPFLGFTPLFSVFGAPALLMWVSYLFCLSRTVQEPTHIT